MTTIALTGGIACGKSTVAGAIHDRGIPVIDSDDLSREAVAPGQPALSEIKQAFGPEVISSDGTIHREALAKLIFSDPEARRSLEAITHQRIKQLWSARLDEWRDEGRRFGVVVIPLLFEAGFEAGFDRVICVACSAATQEERLRSRGLSPSECKQRLMAQLPVQEKITRSRQVVWTEGSRRLIHLQLDRLFAD